MEKKQKGLFIGIFAFAALLCTLYFSRMMGYGVKGCEYFDGVLLDIQEEYLLVQPNEDEKIYKISPEIKVVKAKNLQEEFRKDIKTGDKIRVMYNDVDKKKSPPELGMVYAIYLASELENQ